MSLELKLFEELCEYRRACATILQEHFACNIMQKMDPMVAQADSEINVA